MATLKVLHMTTNIQTLINVSPSLICELNILKSSFNLQMAITAQDHSSMKVIYQHNNYIVFKP